MHLLLTLFTPTVCTFSPFSHKLYVHAQYEQCSHTHLLLTFNMPNVLSVINYIHCPLSVFGSGCVHL